MVLDFMRPERGRGVLTYLSLIKVLGELTLSSLFSNRFGFKNDKEEMPEVKIKIILFYKKLLQSSEGQNIQKLQDEMLKTQVNKF